MSYIKVKSGPHIGDTVILEHEHTDKHGIFERGTEVQIIGFGPRGFDIRDSRGNTMIECGWNL